MNNDDGNGDGNPYVSIGVFDQYKNDQSSLCKAYRNHFETKVTNMERSLKWSVYLTGAVISIIVTVVQLYIALGGLG